MFSAMYVDGDLLLVEYAGIKNARNATKNTKVLLAM